MSSTETPHILVVDDNVPDVRLLVEMLRREGYRISLAFDGERGYHRALAQLPDLILMDVSMPRTDGIVAGRLLKSDPATSHIPIIYLTSAVDVKTRLEALSSVGVDYVTKPYEAEEVLARIRIHSRGSAGRQSKAAPPMRSSEEVLVQACREALRGTLRIENNAESLAQRFNVTLRVLNHAFRKVLGLSASQYLRDERMKEAKRLLTTTCLPIAEIAEELGYSNNANFSTAFKKYEGHSPKEYRWRDYQEAPDDDIPA